MRVSVTSERVGGRVAAGWRMGSGGSLGVLASRASNVVDRGLARLLRDILTRFGDGAAYGQPVLPLSRHCEVKATRDIEHAALCLLAGGVETSTRQTMPKRVHLIVLHLHLGTKPKS